MRIMNMTDLNSIFAELDLLPSSPLSEEVAGLVRDGDIYMAQARALEGRRRHGAQWKRIVTLLGAMTNSDTMDIDGD